MNSIDHLIYKTELAQSETAGVVFAELLNDTNPTFCSPLIEDIGTMFNSILLNYENLSEFQENILEKIANEFNRIRMEIDPKRLKPFDHYFNSDDELLLYRNSEQGLTNLTINSEDCIAFSYIPRNFNEEKKFYLLGIDGDFETLSHDFFSK